MVNTAPTTSRYGRTVKASAAQKNIDQNRSENAAKTAANKERRKKAASKKKQRQKNDAAAAVLGDTTNTASAAAIADLKAQLEASQALAQKLKRKLKKSTRTPAGSAPADDGEIVRIPRPKNNFRIQDAMDSGDNRKLFVELQSGVRALAIQAKVDFDLPWSEQDPAIVAKVLRVLTAQRFPRSWATSSILQRYINSVGGYARGKANPDSGVNRLREKVTSIGRREAREKRSANRAPSPTPPEDDPMDVDETGCPTPPAGPVGDGSTDDDDDDDGSQLDWPSDDGDASADEELAVATD